MDIWILQPQRSIDSHREEVHILQREKTTSIYQLCFCGELQAEVPERQIIKRKFTKKNKAKVNES